jgi:hypothetical protein
MGDFKMLKERKECMLFQTSEKDSRNGWIGGNAPAYFDEMEGMVNKETEMISIFAPKQFEDRISKNRYPDCSLFTMKHPKTEESKFDTFTDPDLVKHYISEASIVSDKASFDERFLIKFGGTPRHIQGEKYYYMGLHDDGFDFLFQVDEDGYPDTLIKPRKSYPFAFGAVYLYAQMLEGSIENPIQSYWQYS